MKALLAPRKLLAVAAILAAGGSQAGGLTLQDSLQIVSKGDFSRSVSLQLAQRSQVSLWLQGWSQKAPAAGNNGVLASGDLNLYGIQLVNGSTTLTFDGQPGNGSLGSPTWTTEQRSNPGSSRGWTAHLQTYELQPLTLDAGNWTLTYFGHDEHQKFASGVALRVQAQNAVSEPAALGLAALSLALGGWLTRRRRA